jgi:hypothetical protein
MELGGGVPRPVDFEALYARPSRSLDAFQRANEVVVRVSAVAEAFSGKMSVHAMRTTTHPLTRAVYERIVADESLHHRLGGLYLDWASPRFDDAERERLAGVALSTLESLATTFRPPTGAPKRRTATLEQIQTIGWVETPRFKAAVESAVRDDIVAPLARYGIVVPQAGVDALFAA